MYLPILRMPRHLLGLLVTTFLCWILCQGEIKFYSDGIRCSQNGTSKLACRQKTVSVIFCVQVGSTDVLRNDVRITRYPHHFSRLSWYLLNYTDSRLQVSSLTKASYTTINITFTELEPEDFNETFFVSIFQKVDSSFKEKVKVWFILKEETESANETSTSEIPARADHGDTTSSVTAANSETTDSIPDAQSKEVNRFLDIGITAVVVLILCTTTGSLIYCCRIRSFKRSRQAISVNIQKELPRQNEVPLLPSVANIPGQSTGSGHGNNSRDRSTCPVELNSPYSQYEEIRNVETGSRKSSIVPASRAFSDIQREQVEYEIPVPERPRDDTPDCYVELMDDPFGVPEKPRDCTPYCYVELIDDPSGVPEKPRDGTPDCYVELMNDLLEVPEKARDGTPDCDVELMNDLLEVPEKARDGTPDCDVELMDDPLDYQRLLVLLAKEYHNLAI